MQCQDVCGAVSLDNATWLRRPLFPHITSLGLARVVYDAELTFLDREAE